MKWIFDDGGREAAGFEGKTGDCVTRAIAIASGKSYAEVYAALNEEAKRERPRKGRKRSSARTGVNRQTYRRYIETLGARWVPTMKIGSGCKVHLKEDELPRGRLIAVLSRHLVAVIDGVARDTHDPSRNETRCVYGYYVFEEDDEREMFARVVATSAESAMAFIGKDAIKAVDAGEPSGKKEWKDGARLYHVFVRSEVCRG